MRVLAGHPPRSARGLAVLVPIALAFADASIVLLALPQIVARLHTSISAVVWVIIVYNLGLMLGASVAWGLARRRVSREMLIGGLILFGVASVGSGVAQSLPWLLVARAFQGLGGGILLCGSLPELGRSCRPNEVPLAKWASAAAIGAALGPAAGGLLTQAFDWRAIFLAQAPFALASALAVWSTGGREETDSVPETRTISPSAEATGVDPPASVGPTLANVALVLLSAGLIGALFLSTLLLINAWGYSPLAAAGVLTLLPVFTALTERLARPLSFGQRTIAGSAALGVGLLVLSVVTRPELGLAIVALVLSGVGVGLAFPALTVVATVGRDEPRQISFTVAARDLGLVIGLLVLTPIFVGQLNRVNGRALPIVARSVFGAPVPSAAKTALATGLLHAAAIAPASALPDLGPPFTAVERGSDPPTRLALRRLRVVVKTEIVDQATRAFRWPLFGSAIFSLLVLPLLLLSRLGARPLLRGSPVRPSA